MSGYKLMGLGVVATPIEVLGRVIEVIVLESLGDVDFSVENGVSTIENLSTGAKGEMLQDNFAPVTSNVELGATVSATWLSFGENRLTAPNVTVGETVFLYNVGNEYYWSVFNYEVDKRGKELLLMGCSNIDRQSEPTSIVAMDKSYYLAFDTIEKSIKLHTSKNDKEKYELDMHFDAKEGKVKIYTGNGEFVLIEKDKITVNSMKEIDILAGNVINLKAKTINIEGANVNIKAKNTKIFGGKLKVEDPTVFSSTTNFKSKMTCNSNAKGPVNKHKLAVML